MQKKGAIEFSMTTIMVIIIGVAVLALSLAWIRGTFTGIGTLTEEAIASAETIVSELGATGKIGVPANIILRQNEVKKFQVAVRNEEGVATLFGIRDLDFVGTNTGSCFSQEVVSASGISIPPGESQKFIVAVGATGTCTNEQSIILRVKVFKNPGVSGQSLYGEEGVSLTVRK